MRWRESPAASSRGLQRPARTGKKGGVRRTGRLHALIGDGLVSAGSIVEDSPMVKLMRALARLTAGIYSVPAAFPAGFSWNLQENPQVVQSRADGRTDLMKSGAP